MNLYKVSQSTGKMQVWCCEVEGEEGDQVTVYYGEEGGKIQHSTYTAETKNVGRSNETTAHEQAVIERDALYVAQQDNKHYCYGRGEAKRLASVCKIPRKVHNFKDHSSKMPQWCYSSIKKNGSRACVINGELFSKIGKREEVKVKHIREAIERLGEYASFDAEVYSHGLSLQRIRAAWTKPVRTPKEIEKVLKKTNLVYDTNEDALGLQLHVFDIPKEGVPFNQRIELMRELEVTVNKLGLERTIKFIYPEWIGCGSERLDYRNCAVSAGYEGLVHYTIDDMYEFGKRSYTCQKDKPRYSSEAYVVGCLKDKSSQGVLQLVTNEEMGSIPFKGKMKGGAESRSFEAQSGFIGSWVTYEYEELSDRGVPTKPTVCETRRCSSTGEPLE